MLENLHIQIEEILQAAMGGREVAVGKRVAQIRME